MLKMSARINQYDQSVLVCNLCTRQLIVDLQLDSSWYQNASTDTDYCPSCATVMTML